jgi:DNA mismatch repair protein MutL
MFHPSQQEMVMIAADESEIPANIDERISKAPQFRLLGMLQDRYVIFESDSGLVLFDPKAARERIIFEQLTKSRKEGMETQNLLVPVLIELDPRDLDHLLREKNALLEAGLEVEAFGGNTLQLRSLPAFLQTEDPKIFLSEILEDTLHGPVSAGKFTFERLARIIANKAAKRVVPRIAEAQSLLEELFECDLPYCAADGRPTLTEFNRKDIDRRFGVGRG